MYKLNLKNATLKTILTWKSITISKLEFKEGNVETHTYKDRRRLGIIPTTIFGKKKCYMNWTSFFGKEKYRTFKYYGGLFISW